MRCSLSCTLLLLASTLTAKADSIATFVVSGTGSVVDYVPTGGNPVTLPPSGTASGDFTFDFTTNTVLSDTVSLTNGIYSTSLNIPLLTSSSATQNSYCLSSLYNCETGSLSLSGGSFYVEDASGHGNNGDRIGQFYTGTISPLTSPVPEPSTIALLGTGLLGLAGAARRRLS